MTTTAPKLTMRYRHRIMTRDHIMAATLEVFAERSNVAVKIDDIVRRARRSISTSTPKLRCCANSAIPG